MMKRFSMMALAAAFLLSSMQLFAGNPSVDEILQKNIKARGGDKVKDVTSASVEMSMEMMGMTVTMKNMIKYPDKMRTESSMMGMSMVTILNGNQGWSVINGAPTEMPAEQVATMRNSLDKQSGVMYKSYLDYKTTGIKFEVAGIEDVKGTPAYKVKETQKDGSVSYIFFSTKDYLELKVSAIDAQTNKYEDIYFTENKVFEGLLLPTKMEGTANGMPVTINITNYKFNESYADSLFKP